MIIRKGMDGDSKRLNELLTELIQDETQYNHGINPGFVVTNFYENYMEDHTKCIYVAVEENNIIGYIYGYLVKTDRTTKYTIGKLDALYVLKKYRNRKIASTLVIAFKDWCVENGAKELEVNVVTKNKAAMNLYKKFNFATKMETLAVRIKK